MKGNTMKIYLLALIICFSTSAYTKDIVVLVPGFFNTFTPEYFSKYIVRAFANKGLKVYIAGDLNPVGTIAENGARLEKILEKIQIAEGHSVDFNIVAHSAGGLYSLWVSEQRKIQIKKLLTISTPFKGIDFIETWIEKSFLFSNLSELAYLQGLKELTPEGVQQFLKTVKVNPDMQFMSFGGHQSENLDITDARYLSAPLLVTSHFINGKSDGIVALNSALGLSESARTDLTINLEHWEQVLEPSAFAFLGIRNTDFIQQEQIRFYTKLADLIRTTQ